MIKHQPTGNRTSLNDNNNKKAFNSLERKMLYIFIPIFVLLPTTLVACCIVLSYDPDCNSRDVNVIEIAIYSIIIIAGIIVFASFSKSVKKYRNHP